MWNEGTRIHFQTTMTILHFDRQILFSIAGSQPVSGADFWGQSISGRPAESRDGRRRSGRESSPHRSPHASPLETLPHEVEIVLAVPSGWAVYIAPPWRNE